MAPQSGGKRRFAGPSGLPSAGRNGIARHSIGITDVIARPKAYRMSFIAPLKRAHKFRAKRTDCAGGHSHPSKAEAKRCDELALLAKANIISGLEHQPKYPCVVNGIKICTYIADFSYRDEGGHVTTEDVKGAITPIYRLKKKLVEALYPYIKITEVQR